MANPFHIAPDRPLGKSGDYLLRSIYWRERCVLAERVVRRMMSNREIGRACHIADLEDKVRALKDELTHQREAAEVRNKQLKAANLIVTCTGGCEGGVIGDHNKLTEEMVFEVEDIAKRLRAKLVNLTHRRERANG